MVQLLLLKPHCPYLSVYPCYLCVRMRCLHFWVSYRHLAHNHHIRPYLWQLFSHNFKLVYNNIDSKMILFSHWSQTWFEILHLRPNRLAVFDQLFANSESKSPSLSGATLYIQTILRSAFSVNKIRKRIPDLQKWRSFEKCIEKFFLKYVAVGK